MRSWQHDARVAGAVVAFTVLLGAPAGLIWSWVAPRFTVEVTANGVSTPNIEGSKAFIGADGSYLLVMLGAGVLCGAVAWVLARRSGPWTVLSLTAGGVLGALVAARVGVLPGTEHVLAALKEHSGVRGQVQLYLGVLPQHGSQPHLRAPWAAVGWPVGALLAFLAGAWWRPEELDPLG